MRLVIHRGTQEIGGSCVELRSGKSRILLDLGMPLVNDKREPFDSKILARKSPDSLKKLKILPRIKGLYKGEKKSVDAILISHSHLDHYGLLRHVHPRIPVYMSEGAGILIEISNTFLPYSAGSLNAFKIKHKRPFKAGDFTITPFLVDHSAFDALAFLVEAGGKRLFYSGDFRGHGRKSALFRQMISNPPGKIDILLMEGSTLGRGTQAYKDENAVQSRIEEILASGNNITFLFASSQNIDRLVSAYKACIRTGRIFVIDIYTAYILDRLKNISKGLPQSNWRNIRVKFEKNQAGTLAKKVSSKLLYKYNAQKIDISGINRNKEKILMLARDNSFFPRLIKGIDNPRGATVIYSMWRGYLSDRFLSFCADKCLAVEHVHTSGHAAVEDLGVFAKALNPKALIPIHTFKGNEYPKIFKNTRILKDGELFEV